jgi:hypothetical protein
LLDLWKAVGLALAALILVDGAKGATACLVGDTFGPAHPFALDFDRYLRSFGADSGQPAGALDATPYLFGYFLLLALTGLHGSSKWRWYLAVAALVPVAVAAVVVAIQVGGTALSDRLMIPLVSFFLCLVAVFPTAFWSLYLTTGRRAGRALLIASLITFGMTFLVTSLWQSGSPTSGVPND